MTPKPVAIGLLLCDRTIIDKDTGSPSAIGIFTGLAVDRFPSEPQRFSVLAMLTDARAMVKASWLSSDWTSTGYGKKKCIPPSIRFVFRIDLRW